MSSVDTNGHSEPTSPTNETSENLRMMMEGRVFERFSFAHKSDDQSDEQPECIKETIFLFYEPSLKLGSFYWCEPGEREKSPDCVIPLGMITDIFLGRQTPELKSRLAIDAGSSDACFSLVTKKASLHLRGENLAIRSAFLAGIRHVFTMVTMVTQTTPNITAMTKGDTFISFSGEPVAKKSVFAWYEPADSKLGTLRWCDAGKKEIVSGQSLQLHRISDVYLGKQATEFKSEEATFASSSQCFSVLAKDKAVHLVAANDVIRTTWLSGIKDVFANVGKKASDSSSVKNSRDRRATGERKTGERPSIERQSIERQPSFERAPVDGAIKPSTEKHPSIVVPPTPVGAAITETNDWNPEATSLAQPILPTEQQAITEQQVAAALSSPTTAAAIETVHQYAATHISPAKTTTLLAHGHEFTAFEGVRPTRSFPVYVWYDESQGKLGTLYWSVVVPGIDNVRTAPSAENSIPFHRITDVFMGKQSDELKSTDAERFSSQLCFSVVSKDRSLHLAASTEAARVEFLSDIKQIFLQNGKKVDTERLAKRNRAAANVDDKKVIQTVVEGHSPLPPVTSPYLETGHTFISFGDDGSHETILLWYVGAGSQLGSLYWSSNGHKVAVPEHSIPVAFIGDIFIGKQTSVLEPLSEQDAVEAYCFSLVANDRALHLQASSALHRTEWLSALRDLFVSAGKRTQKEAFDLMVQQALLDNPKRALLMQGAQFITFVRAPSGQIERRNVFVWYSPEDARLGSLHWSFSLEREKYVVDGTSPQSIPMHRVTDVFMGKQTPELLDGCAKDIPTNRCFSVLTKERGIHLAAEDDNQRSVWLLAIKSLFLESGKKVDDEKAKKKAAIEQAAQNAAVIQRETASVAAVSAAVAPTTELSLAHQSKDPLLEGRDYTLIQQSSVASAFWSRPIFMFYENDSEDPVGRLYWCDRGQRIKVDAQSMPLSKVNHVFMGKQSEEFKSPEGNRYDSKQCVSVVSESLKGRDLHVVADTEAARDELVTALRTVFARASKPTASLSDPAAIQSMMVEGEQVTSYIGAGIIGQSSPAFMWFEPPSQSDKSRSKLGWLHWNDDTLTREIQEGNSLAISHITDVFVGKKTPELLSVEGLFANGDRCLSVMTKKNSVHIEFKSAQSRDAWMTGIKNAYAGGGKIVRESKPGEQPGTRITTIVSTKPQNLKVPATLTEGRAFVRYTLIDNALRKKKIFIWLVKEDGKVGTLYWEDLSKGDAAQPMEKSADRAIPVDSIKDVFIGKQSALMQHVELSSVPADCCLTIVAKENTLDLAAKYPKDRKEWLTAIHTVFISSGRKVVENEQSVSKINMDQPVWTPYGEGLAARYPRADGITPVQLKWAVAYCNIQSIHYLVHVLTPLGPGVLLPLDPSRLDGSVPVQLPSGIVYVPKKDIIPIKSTSVAPSREVTPLASGAATPARRTSTSVASQALKKKPRTSYNPQEAIVLLSRGTPFVLHESGTGKATLIVVWLKVDETPLGTLLFNTAGDGASRGVDRALPVHTITDLYLGASQFPSTFKPDRTNVDRALSIIGRNDTWHLLSEYQDQRLEWFYALHSLIQSTGKDVNTETRSPTAAVFTHFSYVKPIEPAYAEATHLLAGGAVMTQHIMAKEGMVSRPVYVWYSPTDGELGTLFTPVMPSFSAEPARDRHNPWNLQDIRDLFMGSRNFRSALPNPQAVDNNCCLSLVLKDRNELNLEAKDKHTRDAIFSSLVSVLKNGPNLDEEEEEDDEMPDAAPLNTNHRPLPLPQVDHRTEPLPGAVVPGLFQHNGTHVSIDGERETAQMADTAVVTPKNKLLNTTTIPLDSTASSIGTTAPTSLASSQILSSSEPSTVTVAQNASQFTSPDASPKSKRMSNQALRDSVGLVQSATTSSAVRDSEGPNLVDEGIEMIVWTGDDKEAQGTRMFVYWSPAERKRLGSLFWCPVGERSRVVGQELPLHHISDVFLGRHSPPLKSPQAAPIPSDRCFVLFSKNLTFSCQAESKTQREQWIRQFKRKFAQAGGKAVIDTTRKRESTGATVATQVA